MSMRLSDDETKPIEILKTLINIGGGRDSPTGTYIKGFDGHYYLNGGVGNLYATGGGANCGKSLQMDDAQARGLAAMWHTYADDPEFSTVANYDTESNKSMLRLESLLEDIYPLNQHDLVHNKLWTVADKTTMHGNEYYEGIKAYADRKMQLSKNAKYRHKLPWVTYDGKTRIEIVRPSFMGIDSFSDFDVESMVEQTDDNTLGESGANTLWLKGGMAKTRLMMELPRFAFPASLFAGFVSQVGEAPNLAASPHAAPPMKQLSNMKGSQKLKSVGSKFFYYLSSFWMIDRAAPELHPEKKSPMYPAMPGDERAGDKDLYRQVMRNLRCKTGQTDVVINMFYSQTQGVLPDLSNLVRIKEEGKYFGFTGNNSSYKLILHPETTLMRTNIRKSLDESVMLRRATELTSELYQLEEFHRGAWGHLLMKPQELYDAVKAKGFSWDKILNSRGFWVLDEEKNKVPYLSIVDLLLMAIGKEEFDSSHLKGS